MNEGLTTDLFSISGKVALVTGGSRGIGLMIARAYAEAGARVYISSRKAPACEEAAKEMSEYGECIALPTDLSTEAGAKKLAAELAEREEKLHILVNNAGNIWMAPYEDFDEAAWERVLSLNLKSVFHLTRELTPRLKAAAAPGDPARIINIGSIEGIQVPRYDTFSYAAAKAGLHHLTHFLAKRLGPGGITVNAIAPGFFATKLTEFILTQDEEDLIADCPLGRLGEPEDMAGIAIYLASRAGAYVNGVVIPIDGGTIL